ncbi:MAG: hypothetical protein NC340_00525 [Ruminococcus flavefaciens]|nr:hypothetical protein [Ruminococcus flavefaciens]MCM1228597.1 hypothetical protein [Ruminococcus flavefaciens]
MRNLYIHADVSRYDLNGILSFLRNIKGGKVGRLLSVIQKIPEKVIVSVVTSKIARKTLLPGLISILNKKVFDGDTMIGNAEIENTGERSLDVRVNLKYKDYASLLRFAMNMLGDKIKDDKLRAVVNTAVNVISSEIPDNIKDNVINGIVSGASPELCAIANDLLRQKGIPVQLGGVDVRADKI